jgi:hypothetical protein
MIKKSILLWLSIIPLAILNGGVRDYFLTPWIGENRALPVSGITLCLLIFIVSVLFIPLIGKGKASTYWKIGLLWIVLTIVFETFFGLAMGNSLDELLKAYDVTTGNLWLLVVLFTGVTPWLAARARKLFV